MALYKKCAQEYGWNLHDLDETDFETLIMFVYSLDKADPNVKVIGGKEYKRANSCPAWL
jgi:hypothetical protein